MSFTEKLIKNFKLHALIYTLFQNSYLSLKTDFETFNSIVSVKKLYLSELLIKLFEFTVSLTLHKFAHELCIYYAVISLEEEVFWMKLI